MRKNVDQFIFQSTKPYIGCGYLKPALFHRGAIDGTLNAYKASRFGKAGKIRRKLLVFWLADYRCLHLTIACRYAVNRLFSPSLIAA